MIKPTDTERTRRIPGFSLSPKMAGAMKAEAGRRGITPGKLCEELWTLYLQQEKKKP